MLLVTLALKTLVSISQNGSNQIGNHLNRHINKCFQRLIYTQVYAVRIYIGLGNIYRLQQHNAKMNCEI
jgi:hypothetical protein